jgi:hypothetical protein
MIKNLAADFASATGGERADAERALASQEPSLIAMAQAVVELDQTRPAWHQRMERHRRNILQAAG